MDASLSTNYPEPKTYTLSDGIELSFTDIGAPSDSNNYTTVVALHGGGFNAYQFRKVHSYVHALNLRTILLHRRNYAGSTPYTTAELQELEQGNREFWERLSAQLAEFLGMFIEREKVPPLREQLDGTRSGGIAILGWSLGNTTVLSFLATARSPLISDELSTLLKTYIRNCVLYEPSSMAFGYPVPADNPNYIPWDDSGLSTEDRSAAVLQWVGSYYDHPCYDPSRATLIPSITIHDLDDADPRKDRLSTLSSWSEEEMSKGVEGEALQMEALMFSPTMEQTIRDVADQALFDPKAIQTHFPKVEISHIVGTRTFWPCIWGEAELKKRYHSRPPEGCKMRFFSIDGFNHFAHWDEPQRFMQVVAESIH
ncbi:hypothetical protein GYMLUDRAFT_647231 [Collybiopsis luxurians FD-317 M1]|nr:hypothetical protein GYMLUDRAFT_647231 [Collybiopsis luxurians FD-317 M1]